MAKEKKTNLSELIEHVEQAHVIAGNLDDDNEMIVTLAGNQEGFGVVVDGSPNLIFDALTSAIESMTTEFSPDSDYSFEEILNILTDIHSRNETLRTRIEDSPEAVFGEPDKSDMN